MSHLPLFLHRRVFSFPLKLSTSAVCVSGAQRRIHDGKAEPRGERRSLRLHPACPHTQKHTLKQLNLSWLRRFVQNRAGQRKWDVTPTYVVQVSPPRTYGSHPNFCVDLISTFLCAVIHPQHMNIDQVREYSPSAEMVHCISLSAQGTSAKSGVFEMLLQMWIPASRWEKRMAGGAQVHILNEQKTLLRVRYDW